MATRSTIGIKHGNIVKAIYCHWDGYIEHNGFILDRFYQASPKVNNLIALGNLSSLGADIGEKHDFHDKLEHIEIENITHVSTQCTFYQRDRGEEKAEFRTFSSEEAWMDYYDGSGVEYYYLYDKGVWYVSEYRKTFKPLNELVIKLIDEAINNGV